MFQDYAMYVGIFLIIIGSHDMIVYLIRKYKHGMDDRIDKGDK